ncbi:phosphate ABC transporter substrate-binding protein [Pseudoduganella eburnea]|uniref:Phosphate ABC transporter substrate-binding protein n=1 Tax=Massilia eburnea TaxID=1776165 RepID=A0A6L6QPD9_9BURK|nr:phosphate ABC transporter substrate-binding protein [Massilia eburnea]MTW13373.1 phosphate ABC transporter substrate-binding protein [Massilia eburnea]
MIGKLLCCLMLALLAGATAAAELVVVVSAHSAITTLRAEQVADIFLSEATRFPDGGEVVALDLPIGSPLRDDFYLKVANRTPALMKAYWTKKIFTGRGQPPRELPNSMAVRKLVADNPTLIGYIERSALDASVRPVLVVH